ncbi:MAG: response regulator, partial [Acidobacteriota bacterium]
LNLITNAAEALGGGAGTVSVRAFAASPPTQPDSAGGTIDGPSVCLEVQDDGCGMDEETQARLFDPFYSTKKTGRGLGMATVQGVARRHRAVTQVESALGVGSTVRIYFPCSEDPSRKAAATLARAPVSSRGSATLLVVDDEEAVRRTAVSILRHRGFRVLEAADGRQAIDVFRLREEVDLVLLDLTMPGLDGLETMARLRSVRPVPVILTSGFSEHHVSSAAADGFLEKPYSPRRLIESIATVMPEALRPARDG